MTVFYYGADSPWNNQSENEINRRNLAILYTLSKSEKVEKIYNIIRCDKQLMYSKQKEIRPSTKIENLYIAPIIPERSFLKIFTRPLNKLLLKRKFSKKLRNINTSVSWCYWPNGFEDFELLGLNNTLVFDTDHNIIEDPNLSEDQKPNRKQLLLRAGKKAAFIISSSRSMLNWFQSYQMSHTYLFLNGVFKSRIANKSTKRPVDKSRYTVTYSGTLSKWIQTDWFFRMIENHPQWTFHIIGSNYKTELTSRLEAFKNVRLHGYLPYVDAKPILQKSDVCFGLYQKHPALDVNSMKLYDYLANGLPVVVNDFHCHLEKDFNGLLNVAATYEEFIKYSKKPQPYHNASRVEFLEQSTWENRVDDFLEHLMPKINGLKRSV